MSILQYAFSWLHIVFCHTLLTRYKWHIQIFTVHSKCLGKFWWWWCYCDILWHSLTDSVPMLFPNSACFKNTFSFWSDKNQIVLFFIAMFVLTGECCVPKSGTSVHSHSYALVPLVLLFWEIQHQNEWNCWKILNTN